MNRRTYPVSVEKIQELRQLCGMSLEALALKAGIHVKTLRRILNKTTEPYLETINLLATALKVTSESLREQVNLQPSRVDFCLNLSIEGSADTPDRLATLVTLTPSVIATLKAAGITIRGIESSLKLDEYQGEALKRTVMLLYGLLTDGNPFWSFVAIRPSKYPLLLTAHKEGTLDLHKFDVYGEVIVSGEGKSPPDDVVLQVADMYRLPDPQSFKQCVYADVARTHGTSLDQDPER